MQGYGYGLPFGEGGCDVAKTLQSVGSAKRPRALLAVIDILFALVAKRRITAILVTGVAAVVLLCSCGFLALSFPGVCFWLWTTPSIRDYPIPTLTGPREAWRVGFDGLRCSETGAAVFFRRAATGVYPQEIRQFALWALARDHPVLASEVLPQLLKDPDVRIRLAVCEFLVEETFHDLVLSRRAVWKDGAPASYGSLGASLVVYHERERLRDPIWMAALETLHIGEPEYSAPVRKKPQSRPKDPEQALQVHGVIVSEGAGSPRAVTHRLGYDMPAMLTAEDRRALEAAGWIESNGGARRGGGLFPSSR